MWSGFGSVPKNGVYFNNQSVLFNDGKEEVYNEKKVQRPSVRPDSYTLQSTFVKSFLTQIKIMS